MPAVRGILLPMGIAGVRAGTVAALAGLVAAGCLDAPPDGAGASLDASAAGDGGSALADSAPGQCIAIVSDSFSNPATSEDLWEFWQEGGAAWGFDESAIRFDATGGTASGYADMYSLALAATGNTELVARLVVDVTGNGEFAVAFTADSEDKIEVVGYQGSFYAGRVGDGEQTTFCDACLPFENGTWFIRLRHQGEMVTAEVSSDGEGWSELGSTVPLSDAVRAHAHVYASDSGDTASLLLDSMQWVDCSGS